VRVVTLSKLGGKHVLLAFFPPAFTCTREMCSFTEDYDTPGTRPENEELLGQLENRQRSA
jgi:peroxiredoxin